MIIDDQSCYDDMRIKLAQTVPLLSGETFDIASYIDREMKDELDEVLTLAVTGRASTRTWRFGTASRIRASYGAELYFDSLSSEAENEVLSTGERTVQVRGKYLDGSTYLSTAGFGFAELTLSRDLSFTAGLRANAIATAVPN